MNDTDATTNAVNENAAVGTTVGITSSASDADATTNGITYSLMNDDGGRFAINSSTGVVTVAGAINANPMGRLGTSLFVLPQPMDLSLTRLTRSQSNDVDEFDVGAVSDADATTNAVNENATIAPRLASRPQPQMRTQQPTYHLLTRK